MKKLLKKIRREARCMKSVKQSGGLWKWGMLILIGGLCYGAYLALEISNIIKSIGEIHNLNKISDDLEEEDEEE